MSTLRLSIISFLETSQRTRAQLRKMGTGIRFLDLGLLLQIERRQEMTVKSIAEFAQMSNASASTFVSKMKKLGYLKMTKNPDDGRSFFVELTDQGHKEISRKKEEALTLLSPHFSKLNLAEQAQLIALLEKLSI